MRIAVVGTCQVAGIRNALQALLPSATVDPFHVGVYPLLSAAEIADSLPSYDFVLSQMLPAHGFPALEFDRISATTRVQLVPHVVFTGFHPDCVYVFVDGHPVQTEVGPYHSAIAAAGFLLNLPIARTLRLYNAYIFAQLGYFDEYGSALDLLVTSCAGLSYDITPYLGTWAQDGCFMHTVNHPKISVLATLAVIGAREAGVLEPTTAVPQGVADPLERNVAWAVYPEIAERLGIATDQDFRLVWHSENTNRRITLPEIVARSYALYEQLPRESLFAGRIWQNYEILRKLL